MLAVSDVGSGHLSLMFVLRIHNYQARTRSLMQLLLLTDM